MVFNLKHDHLSDTNYINSSQTTYPFKINLYRLWVAAEDVIRRNDLWSFAIKKLITFYVATCLKNMKGVSLLGNRLFEECGPDL